MYLKMREEYGMDKFYLPEHCKKCDELANLLEMDDVPMISGVNKPFDLGLLKKDPTDV